jgi:hypothetical protein
MIEFRYGGLGAMVWSDGNGNWDTGGWRPLSRRGAALPSGQKAGR